MRANAHLESLRIFSHFFDTGKAANNISFPAKFSPQTPQKSMVIMDISGPNPMDMCQRTGTKRMLVIWLATQWIYLLPSSAPRRAHRCQISLFNRAVECPFAVWQTRNGINSTGSDKSGRIYTKCLVACQGDALVDRLFEMYTRYQTRRKQARWHTVASYLYNYRTGFQWTKLLFTNEGNI